MHILSIQYGNGKAEIVRHFLLMKFNRQHRQYPLGAQCIGTPPIYRPGERIDEPLADKSAVRA